LSNSNQPPQLLAKIAPPPSTTSHCQQHTTKTPVPHTNHTSGQVEKRGRQLAIERKEERGLKFPIAISSFSSGS
jgi:hypothetical protein